MDDFTTQYMKFWLNRPKPDFDMIRRFNAEIVPMKINYEPCKLEFGTDNGKVTIDGFRVTFTDGDKDVN